MQNGARRSPTLQLHEKDNVAVVIQPPTSEEPTVPYGHKMAVAAIPKGEPVIKYGEIIGYAMTDIQAGDWVHTHNMGEKEQIQ